ncbi:outer-membrane lipoprotein carrier protein LolA [bacterium]|nr:outer-membrane lipoprotein carrier protein LolA [bacterium]
MKCEVLLWLFFLSFAAEAGPVKASEVDLLKKVDGKYLAAKTVTMNVNKTDKTAALEQTKSSEGTLKMKKGKFRLELESADASKEKSMIIVDGKNLWYVTPPLKDVKNSKTQVVKTNLVDKKNKTQSLLRVLTEGGVFRFFEVTKSVEQEDMVIYFLKPSKPSPEMQKAQMLVDKNKQVIAQLKYWDALENETTYQFTSVTFDQSLKEDLFKYAPPKDAQVSQY